MDETINIREMVKETVFVAGPDAWPLPEITLIDGKTFYADGVTPLDLNDDYYRLMGWKKQSRWVSPWVEEE